MGRSWIVTLVAALIRALFWPKKTTKPAPKEVAADVDPMRNIKLIPVEMPITNDADHDVHCILEPWGDSFLLEQGQTILLTGDGPEGGSVELSRDDTSITAYGWPGSLLKATFNGEVVCQGIMRVPGLPLGIKASREFIDLMFGSDHPDKSPKDSE